MESFCSGEKTRFSIIPNHGWHSENTHEEQATRIEQRLALWVTSPEGRSGSLAVRALGLSFSASGDTARSNPKQQRRQSLSGYRQLALDSNTPGSSYPRASSPLLAKRPDAVRVGAIPMVPIACAAAAAADEPSLILLALAWIVGSPVCSDVLELVVSGLAAPPVPFLLPTEPVRGMCPKAAPLLPHSVGVPASPPISVPASAAEAATDADADAVVVESNHPNTWNGNMLSIVTPLTLNGLTPPNGVLSRPKEGTSLSAYSANRPAASSTTA